MIRWKSPLIGILLLSLWGHVFAAEPLWTWISGSKVQNYYGVYGTKKVSAPENRPGARQDAALWMDGSGKICVWGGLGYDSANKGVYLNDLWRFDPANGQWTWIKGTAVPSHAPIYNSLGYADPISDAGGRDGFASWETADGKFWVFGGPSRNDLWMFDPSIQNWTWMKGSNVGASHYGVYGVKGVEDSANNPGDRKAAVTWTDDSGRLWLFGGTGHGATTSGPLSDLWRYDPASGNWTWIAGSNESDSTGAPSARAGGSGWKDKSGKLWLFGGAVRNDLWSFDPATSQWTLIKDAKAGVYGVRGQPYPTNMIPARSYAEGWADDTGKIWIFGGTDTKNHWYNDLWCFDPVKGYWTWMQGSDLAGQPGVYGVQGSAAAENIPRARSNAALLRDASGHVWLWGGVSGIGPLNDLWRFDQASGTWTWVSGPSFKCQTAISGAPGTSDPAYTPGARSDAVTWTDAYGRFWLYGGQGYDNLGNMVYLSDIWRLDPVSGQWALIKGNPDPSQPASSVFGTQGVADPANTPGPRSLSGSWSDTTGRLWLFGGTTTTTLDSNYIADHRNDLWCFDPTTGNWTWIKGGKLTNQKGVAGTRGVANPANTPGARKEVATWTDPSGHFWIFGGTGYDTDGAYSFMYPLADLWRFDPRTGNWTWVKGISYDLLGIYGSQGVSDPANLPPGKRNPVSWTDKAGRLWLFGGQASEHDNGYRYNDLWCFDPVSGNWTWVKGAKSFNGTAVAGAQGVEGIANTPSARVRAASWVDRSGRFWLMGGGSSGSSPYNKYYCAYYNDLWSVNPCTCNWAWLKGVTVSTGALGVYGTQGVPALANAPSARGGAACWTGKDGRLWLYGGNGNTSQAGPDPLADLWVLSVPTGIENEQWRQYQ